LLNALFTTALSNNMNKIGRSTGHPCETRRISIVLLHHILPRR